MIEIERIPDAEQYLDGISAVIFDLDDTLYPEKEYVRSGYRAIAAAYEKIPDLDKELYEAFRQKQPAIDVVFAKHGLQDEKEKALKIYRFHKPDISLYPGVREMLSRLAVSKKVGIITDGRPEGQRAKIEALGLTDIPFLITDELGGTEYRKPCADAYRILCEKFRVPYADSVYIGDNIRKDFIAPAQLGMQAIYFRNKDGLYYA